MKKKSISIITIVYNGKSSIEKTILSVINQTYLDYEFIVIDGGSTDGTTEILDRYKSKIDILISEPDKGIYDAMNKGMSQASSEYMIFMNGGDAFYNKNVLSDIFDIVPHGVDIIAGECMYVNEEDQELGLRSVLTKRALPHIISKYTFLYGSNISHQSFIARRDLTVHFDLRYKYVSDLDWMIKMMTRSNHFFIYKPPISNFMVGGTSHQNWKTAMKERWRLYNHHYGLLLTFWAHLVIIFNNLARRLTF